MAPNAQSPRACEICSNRKIKCDRKLPSCTQCSKGTKSKRRCLYRQASLELNLRDETNKIAAICGNHDSQKSRHSPPQIFSKDEHLDCVQPLVWYEHQPLDRFFIDDLVLAAGRNILLTKFPHGVYHQYLPGIYLSSTTCPTLTLSVETIGLVCLSLGRNESQLMLRAREKHVVALRTTNQLVSRVTDTTTPYSLVASIMLIALFAVMSPDNINARDIWTKHVDGALSILGTWISEQSYAPTPAAQNLVAHIINCVQLSYFQQRKPVPTLTLRLYNGVRDSGCMQARLHAIINGLSNMHSGTTRSTYCYQEEALLWDQELVSIMAMLEQTHPFKLASGYTNQSGEPICHEYSSHRAAQIWNFVRVLRLSLNDQLLSHLTKVEQTCPDMTSAGVWLPLDGQNLQRRTLTAVASTAFDICASVPSFLRPGSSSHTSGVKLNATNRPDMVHWAHSLIWPLAMAKDATNTPKTLTVFIDSILEILWQAAKFPNTTMPEREYMEGMELKDWTHIFFWC